MRVPPMQRYDEMDAVFFSSAFAAQGVVIEPVTRTLMLQPFPLQCPTVLSEWAARHTGAEEDGTGTGDTADAWQETQDAATGLTVLEMPDATPGSLFGITSLYGLTEGGSFYVNVFRSQQAGDDARDPTTLYTQVWLGDSVLGGLRLTLAYGQPPILEMCTDDGADTGDGSVSTGTVVYTEVARDTSVPDCEAYLAAQADRTFRLRVLCLATAGTIIVSLGQGDATLVCRMDGLTQVEGPLTVSGKNGVARVQYQPMRWVPTGSLISNIRDNGLAIVNTPVASTDSTTSDLSTVTVEGEILLETAYRYAVTLDASASVDASGLATETPLVRSVTILFPGVTYNGMSATEVELNLRRVREQLVFSLDTLSYEQMAWLTCNNHDARWTGASGYRACYLDAGIDGDNWRRITGWIGGIQQSRNDPSRETTFLLYGKEHWLKRKVVGIIPPFDGWDIYGAIRFLANLGGITDDFLVALPYAPPGRGSDTPYFHLPLGTGALGAKFQFDPRTRIWSAMQQLARLVRGYLGFDVYGYLRFYRWEPSSLGGYMQAFDVVPDAQADGQALLNQLKGTFAANIDMSDVRSDIILGSLDPFSFLPVFSHWHNESVITNLADPAFLGNTDVEIEINSLLFDPDLQNETLSALSYQASLPTLTTGLTGFFQRQLLPLDIITVTDGFCLGGLYPFYIDSMSSDYGIDQQAMFGATHLNGRWIENL